MNRDQLCIGTVKFGVPDYGFSSQEGRAFDAGAFVRDVLARGIHRFDTAPRYGDSEAVLGRAFAGLGEPVWISSKGEDLVVRSPDNAVHMEESARRSIERLGVDALDLFYLHQNELTILQDPTVHAGLARLKELGIVRAVGASVYSHDECAYALGSGVFDYIQVPVSVLDVGFYDRFIKNNTSAVKFVARSLLLQGLIVNRTYGRERIKQWDGIADHLAFLDEHAAALGLSTLELALAFVFSLPDIDHAIIGTTSIGNVEKNIACLDLALPEEIHRSLYARAVKPRTWTNPRHWV